MSEDDLKMGRRILDLPMGPNDADAVTVRGYLAALVAEVWQHDECFNGKRPFGNSGWTRELELPLVDAGLISGKVECENGYRWTDDCDSGLAGKLIHLAIKALGVSNE